MNSTGGGTPLSLKKYAHDMQGNIMFVEGAYKKIVSFFNLKKKTLTTYFLKEISIVGGVH